MHTNNFQKQLSRLKIATLTLVLPTLLTACPKHGTLPSSSTDNSTNVGPSNSSSAVPSTTPTPTPTPVASPSPTPVATPTPTPTPTPVAYKAQPLAWESATHSERTSWSTGTMQIVSTYFSQLDKATDITAFCPTYKSLSQDQRINLWADLFASTAYYESGWNPAEYSVDVGTANDSSTWSVGLLQMSVIDQESYGFPFGYNFADLQTPLKNMQLAVAIMARQVTKYGIVMIPTGHSGLYWATLHPGGEYDESANIQKMTKKLSFCQ